MSRGKRIGNDWAKDHLAALARGVTVSFRPVGGSMAPLIESGQLVEVGPADAIATGAVVLAQVGNFTYLHLVKDTRVTVHGKEYLIGNNRGGINGWVPRNAIHGVLLSVKP